MTNTDESDGKNGTDVVVEPYTIFSGWRRILLLVLLSFTGVWSSISNSIYFPALPSLSAQFHQSNELTNLSLVAYLICQGLVPTVTSNFADTFGRRPVIVCCFVIYICSCIGLSQTSSYGVFVFLRCLQASGIAPVIAINAGISGDVCTQKDRGGFVGIVSGMLLVGQAFGSLLGSALVSRWSWRAIFLFLAIGLGATLLLLLLMLTETARHIVGNGSVWPGWVHRAPVLYVNSFRRHMNDAQSTRLERKKINMWAPLQTFSSFRLASALVTAGFQYCVWTMSLTTLSTELEDTFGYSTLHTGFLYLPQGLCCLFASFGTGKLLNMYYVRCKTKHMRRVEAGTASEPFDSVRARLDCSILPMVISLAGLLLFGWALQKSRNVPAAVVGTCLLSFGSACFIAIVTTLVVDLHPTNGSAATSALNLVRCLLAALGVGVLDYMQRRMGIGGCYTFWAAINLVSALVVLLAMWMHKRKRVQKDK